MFHVTANLKIINFLNLMIIIFLHLLLDKCINAKKTLEPQNNLSEQTSIQSEMCLSEWSSVQTENTDRCSRILHESDNASQNFSLRQSETSEEENTGCFGIFRSKFFKTKKKNKKTNNPISHNDKHLKSQELKTPSSQIVYSLEVSSEEKDVSTSLTTKDPLENQNQDKSESSSKRTQSRFSNGKIPAMKKGQTQHKIHHLVIKSKFLPKKLVDLENGLSVDLTPEEAYVLVVKGVFTQNEKFLTPICAILMEPGVYIYIMKLHLHIFKEYFTNFLCAKDIQRLDLMISSENCYDISKMIRQELFGNIMRIFHQLKSNEHAIFSNQLFEMSNFSQNHLLLTQYCEKKIQLDIMVDDRVVLRGVAEQYPIHVLKIPFKNHSFEHIFQNYRRKVLVFPEKAHNNLINLAFSTKVGVFDIIPTILKQLEETGFLDIPFLMDFAKFREKAGNQIKYLNSIGQFTSICDQRQVEIDSSSSIFFCDNKVRRLVDIFYCRHVLRVNCSKIPFWFTLKSDVKMLDFYQREISHIYSLISPNDFNFISAFIDDKSSFSSSNGMESIFNSGTKKNPIFERVKQPSKTNEDNLMMKNKDISSPEFDEESSKSERGMLKRENKESPSPEFNKESPRLEGNFLMTRQKESQSPELSKSKLSNPDIRNCSTAIQKTSSPRKNEEKVKIDYQNGTTNYKTEQAYVSLGDISRKNENQGTNINKEDALLKADREHPRKYEPEQKNIKHNQTVIECHQESVIIEEKISPEEFFMFGKMTDLIFRRPQLYLNALFFDDFCFLEATLRPSLKYLDISVNKISSFKLPNITLQSRVMIINFHNLMRLQSKRSEKLPLFSIEKQILELHNLNCHVLNPLTTFEQIIFNNVEFLYEKMILKARCVTFTSCSGTHLSLSGSIDHAKFLGSPNISLSLDQIFLNMKSLYFEKIFGKTRLFKMIISFENISKHVYLFDMKENTLKITNYCLDGLLLLPKSIIKVELDHCKLNNFYVPNSISLFIKNCFGSIVYEKYGKLLLNKESLIKKDGSGWPQFSHVCYEHSLQKIQFDEEIKTQSLPLEQNFFSVGSESTRTQLTI